jgi:hypothetical protein
MNIKFTNNSVSGLNRRYRGFDFELPGSTSKTMDVPEQYVENLTTYLKEKHPAVICEKVEVEKTDAPPVADGTEEKTKENTEAGATEGAGSAGNDGNQVAPLPDANEPAAKVEGEAEKTDAPPVADADSAPANTGGSESGTGQKEKEAAGPGNANSSGNKNKKGGGNKK